MLQENFITFVAQDNGVEARAALQDDLSQRVLDHLEERKRELAKGLFSGGTEQVTEAKEEDAKHDDEEEDEKLVKKLVKKDCLTKEATDLTDFLKKGGKITQVKPHAAHGAQAKQKTKVPMRHLGALTPRKDK